MLNKFDYIKTKDFLVSLYAYMYLHTQTKTNEHGKSKEPGENMCNL